MYKIDEQFAAFRVFGENLDLEHISRELGIRSSKYYRAGELSLTSKPYPNDVWFFESSLSRTESLNAHLIWLRKELLPHYEFLRSLLRTSEITESSVYCALTAEDDKCSFRLAPDALKIFLELEIEMELSLVFVGSNIVSGSPTQMDIDGCVEEPKNEATAQRRESEVLLLVHGNNFDSRDITGVLGFQPSQNQRNTWSLKVPLSATEELDAHLNWLSGALPPYSDFIRSLKGQGELSIVCNIGTSCAWGSVWLSSEVFRLPINLGIPIEFNARVL